MLLWKIMEENPAFTQYVLKHCDVNEVSPEVRHLGVSSRKCAFFLFFRYVFYVLQ